ELGITTIFVTHDQAEALSLSNKVAVMDAGRLVQVGTPEEIYLRPSTPFVADFVGGCSFVTGVVASADETSLVIDVAGSASITLPRALVSAPVGGQVKAVVRPEWVSVLPSGQGPAGPNQVDAEVLGVEFIGGRYLHHAKIGDAVFRF